MPFLHGFEFIETTKFVPIKMVRSSVIGLVGTAPDPAPVNEPKLILNRTDAATIFGDPGEIGNDAYTIPMALKAIFDQGEGGLVGAVVVINLYDETDHLGDPSNVTATEIEGGIDGVTGKKQGIKAFEDASSLFGVIPKILIAPQYSSTSTVLDALINAADSLRAIAVGEPNEGDDKDTFQTYAGNFDSSRLMLHYPNYKTLSPVDDSEIVVPVSPYYAGALSRLDNEKGFWHSPSNITVRGITGLERPVAFSSFHDQNSEANLLNENNISTTIHYQGWRLWGNRSVMATNDPGFEFIAVRRQFDMIEDSIELGTLHLLDRPINKAFIEDLQDNVQAYLDSLIGRQAIIYGNVVIAEEDNPPSEIANGHITARLTITPTYPAERITYKTTLDIEPLRLLFASEDQAV